MKDRLAFEETRLPNGIRVFSHRMDVPFFSIHAILPIGSVHSHTENPHGIGGIAHFLEHMIFKRSKLYPALNSFEKFASLKGVSMNATTSAFETDVYADIPTAVQPEIIDGFVSQIFEPLFTDEDIAVERGVVANERNQRKYYPGRTELQRYLNMEWEYDRYYPKEQLFGSDTDLSAIDVGQLEGFHTNYKAASDVFVVVAGGHDIGSICKAFEGIETQPLSRIDRHEAIAWKRREYHERTFRDLDSPNLYLGGIVPQYDLIEVAKLSFIMNLLTNSSHGPLYEWTRNEKGWTYGVRGGTTSGRDRMTWTLQFPLNDIGPVEQIRHEVWGRVEEALADQFLVDREIERILNQEVFFYQTAGRRAEDAADSLSANGRIVTEREYRNLAKGMHDLSLLREAYTRYFTGDVVGEFLALPEEK